MSEIKYPAHWYEGGDMSNFYNHKYSNGGYCIMTSWQFKTWKDATNFKLNLDSALRLQESITDLATADEMFQSLLKDSEKT